MLQKPQSTVRRTDTMRDGRVALSPGQLATEASKLRQKIQASFEHCLLCPRREGCWHVEDGWEARPGAFQPEALKKLLEAPSKGDGLPALLAHVALLQLRSGRAALGMQTIHPTAFPGGKVI